MILGNVCTRNCAFCAVSHSKAGEADQEEPVRLKEAVNVSGLKHIVVTSVTPHNIETIPRLYPLPQYRHGASSRRGFLACWLKPRKEPVPERW
ncbi:hypothetical protein L9W92_06245 [Pelotomaculum terephthalicicum JT]|uniref:hypothetical protein n=1 Tax=Pelotomaculum TaxID=191373 RepID=UPI0009CAA93B|nr:MULTISPECIES: hypothetical protein [Pelotomaculum]MCG9967653.1 hypothetical protein [Pelotomaculum terephthalicicum JT]OPY59412.1 MAG: Lipoyl synthase [Pelotomaculum sp. PtaU1.Bin065]